MRRMVGFVVLFLLLGTCASAEIFGRVRGVVHDPQHRPIGGARVVVQAVGSPVKQSAVTGLDGAFLVPALPLGEYVVTVTSPGFGGLAERLSVTSNTVPWLHFELPIVGPNEAVTVTSPEAENAGPVSPTTVVSQVEIAETPGADRTNSVRMITDFVPGAYVTHDMLHMRGGHQVSWEIDGVQIPNTNIASNLGAQIDPKDIATLEIGRGSYNAEVGDRTYGVFNVVPRSGFDRQRDVEVVLSGGSFLAANSQINVGDHTEKMAYYASVNGNRSDYGLSPPVAEVRHDAANGVGGFASLLDNRTPKDQLRLVGQWRTDFFQIPYDPDPASEGNQLYDSSGLRDGQQETDGMVAATWARTLGVSGLLQLSPFYHYNRADYEAKATDLPVATTSDRRSIYAGVQTSLTGQVRRQTVQGGLYGFGQHDGYRFGSVFNDGSATDFNVAAGQAGGLVEGYVSDNLRATEWLTFTGGVRVSRFMGDFAEVATSPRVGASLRVPRLGWVFRGFYGRFYQPPPLLSISGPTADYATSQNTAFLPLHGERDEEHQFGVRIPWRGWVVDADTFKTRAKNFLDHSNLGESSLYYPVSIDGALIQGWELTLNSPRTWRFGRGHLAYSNQVAKQRGALTGGLVCAPIGSADCEAGFAYTPLDHDQRNTLSGGYGATLPGRVTASVEASYGSGFHNGSPDAHYPGAYLPGHASVDLSASRAFGERTTVGVTVLNVADQRVLLDNSLTFGGFHFSDPREVYGEVRFRFRR